MDTWGAWQPTPRGSLRAPAGAASAWVYVTLRKAASGASVLGGFDHVFFGPPIEGDMDGLGDTDLVLHSLTAPARHEVWMMNGVTRLARATITPDASGAVTTLVGVDDFTDDGIQDLVFWSPTTGQVQFWAMDDRGTKRAGTPIDLAGAAPLPVPWRLAAMGDFDHDRRTDLLWSNSTSGKIVLWFMDANVVRITGQFTNPSAAGGQPETLDIVWRNETSGKMVAWYMDTAGNRTSRVFTTPSAHKEPLGCTVVGPK